MSLSRFRLGCNPLHNTLAVSNSGSCCEMCVAVLCDRKLRRLLGVDLEPAAHLNRHTVFLLEEVACSGCKAGSWAPLTAAEVPLAVRR